MSNEQAALTILILILIGFLVVGALASPTLLLPKPPKVRKRGKPAKAVHEAAITRALAFLDTTTSDVGMIGLHCRECGQRKYQPTDTAIETTVNGLVCVAVCWSCGAALVSRILKPAEAAVYVDAGAARVWPRLVSFRSELQADDLVAAMRSAAP